MTPTLVVVLTPTASQLLLPSVATENNEILLAVVKTFSQLSPSTERINLVPRIPNSKGRNEINVLVGIYIMYKENKVF